MDIKDIEEETEKINKLGAKPITFVGMQIKIFTDDIDSLSDLAEYITDKFGSAVWKWL